MIEPKEGGRWLLQHDAPAHTRTLTHTHTLVAYLYSNRILGHADPSVGVPLERLLVIGSFDTLELPLDLLRAWLGQGRPHASLTSFLTLLLLLLLLLFGGEGCPGERGQDMVSEIETLLWAVFVAWQADAGPHRVHAKFVL